jgi:hypothetical protein
MSVRVKNIPNWDSRRELSRASPASMLYHGRWEDNFGIDSKLVCLEDRGESIFHSINQFSYLTNGISLANMLVGLSRDFYHLAVLNVNY